MAKVEGSSRGGAKPGERRGGRSKGTRNRRTQATIDGVEATGLTPLAYLLGVMRDERNDIEQRMDAAKAAAPYVHAKLSAIDARVAFDGQLTINVNKPGPVH